MQIKVCFSILLLILCLHRGYPQAPRVGIYHFGLEGSPTEQINFLYKQGLNAIVFEVVENTMDEYFNTLLVRSRLFEIHSVYVYWNPAEKINTSFYQKILDRTKISGSIFQLIVQDKGKSFDEVKDSLKVISQLARKNGQTITIYPHYGDFIQCAEEAVYMIKELGENNVKTAIHLCHELKKGNGKRMTEVVQNVKDYISTVSISGASIEEIEQLPNFADAIKPLHIGTYDKIEFHKALQEAEYSGPYIIHTYGIKENFGLSPNQYIGSAINCIRQLINTTNKQQFCKYICPGRIEAESFDSLQGNIEIELINDFEGRKCVYPKNGRVNVSYPIYVTENGAYIIKLRQRYVQKEISISINDKNFKIPCTYDSTWRTVQHQVELDTGNHTIHVSWTEGQLNWLETIPYIKPAPSPQLETLTISNNPTTSYFHIYSDEFQTYNLYNIKGCIIEIIEGKGWVNLGEYLPAGMYLLKFNTQTYRLIKQ